MRDLKRFAMQVGLLAVVGCTFEGSGQEGAATAPLELGSLLVEQGYIEVPMIRLPTGHYSVTGRAEEVTLDLIVDTGSSHTLLDTDRVGRFGITTGDHGSRATGLDYANRAVRTGRLENVDVGGVRMDTLRITVVDLSQVNRVLERMGEEQVDGILGSDALVARRAVIDYGSRSLYLKE